MPLILTLSKHYGGGNLDTPLEESQIFDYSPETTLSSGAESSIFGSSMAAATSSGCQNASTAAAGFAFFLIFFLGDWGLFDNFDWFYIVLWLSPANSIVLLSHMK